LPIDDADTVRELDAWRERHQPAYRLLEPDPTLDIPKIEAWIRETLGRDGLPVSLVANARGQVLATRWGVPTVSELRALLRRAE